ncbi:MAG: transglutaminase family protein [Gammaproteobacteria bacterium]|nr:transglutaminase family protein [Gammaproteobacteria bacterium]
MSQEHGHSRWVDASTARLEISLRTRPGTARETFADWQLTINGYRLPLRQEDELEGETWLCGVRYRRFKPWTGLHPSLEAQGPLELILSHPNHSGVLRMTLYEWRPQGGGYDGLPRGLEDAAARCAERFVIEHVDTAPLESPLEPPPEAVTPYTFDLRWL